ncbi:MAG: hypothetical protein A2Y89_03375 [Chloroflexi bacterium RBG_13_51_18]|nr:MAG: hypothetical protein A2Y89_03375 [Chloroflexi bacterium RBG_13_51_18]
MPKEIIATIILTIVLIPIGILLTYNMGEGQTLAILKEALSPQKQVIVTKSVTTIIKPPKTKNNING